MLLHNFGEMLHNSHVIHSSAITIILAISVLFNFWHIFSVINLKRKKMTDQQITLTFVKGRDGKVIARTETGKICLLDINYCKQNKIWVNEYEDWRCGIKEEREACIIVQPISRTATAEDNKHLIDDKVGQLKDKFNKKGSPPKKPGNL